MRIKLRLRGLTALAVSTVFVLSSTAWGAGGTAQAVAATPPHPSSTNTISPTHSTPTHSTPSTSGTSNTAPAAPSRSAQLAQQHYRPAGCNTPSTATPAGAIPVARCFALGLTDAAGRMAVRVAAAGPPSTAMTPTQLQNAYNLPDGGAGMTVAIVDAFGYNNAESDLAVYRSFYGLPACTTANGCFTKVDQAGGTNYPPQDGGWSIETALDLDAVSSVCPKCRLLLVQGTTPALDDLGKAVDTAASLGANVVSNSYGANESPDQVQYDNYYNHPGVAVTVSTGDTGNVNSWPASVNQVTAVGGTLLTQDGSGRGWAESAWVDGGSGCSPYEPHPDYQNGLSTNCPTGKANADISADADPASGLGVYNTLGQAGWAQWGGTSLSAPLVAGMYALAGRATPNTYPVSYPYRDVNQARDINDITAGNNGSCGNVLCQTGIGWDGPTGLGTPKGVAGLTQGEHGDIIGTVTDSVTAKPILGVTVSATATDGTTYHATTDAKGSYDIPAATGTYGLTSSKYGYAGKSLSGVAVTKNYSVTENFTLTAQATKTVSGKVSDGSGHGWPMYARITIDGYPNGAVYTDPYTGHYSVALPAGNTYKMHVGSAELSGYVDQDVTVNLTAAGASQNIALKVDAVSCSAPGYAYADTGLETDFTGWSGKTPQAGWSITDGVGNGQTWVFDNPGGWDPPVGGDSHFADIDSDHYGQGGSQNSSLVSPVVDLSHLSTAGHPEIGFDSTYIGFPGQSGDVDLSLDGGKTWSTLWQGDSGGNPGRVDVPIPQAAGQAKVQVRFHFTGSWSRRWELDNVLLGGRTCAPTPGGLMAGVVTDANTKAPLNGATVAGSADPTSFGVSMPTPDDANLSDGYYWLFSPHTGAMKFTVTDGRYTAMTGTVALPANSVLHRDWKLGAGHLRSSTHSIAQTGQLGATTSGTVTFTNDGTAAVHVNLSEEDGGFTPMNGQHQATMPGAPTQLVPAKVSYAALPPATGGAVVRPGAVAQVNGHKVALRQASPSVGPWTDIANLPSGLMDDAVAYHAGKVYVVGGTDGSNVQNGVNVYDPATRAWTPLANLPERLNGPVAAFIGTRLYVAGGWNATSGASTHAYSYDPGSNVWSQLADLPGGAAMAGSAVVGGRLYVVGGCTDGTCTGSSSVFSYSPDSGAWTQAPQYPQTVAFLSCGSAAAEIVCAGGVNTSSGASTASTYTYLPGAGTWQKRADLPVDAWGASSSSADGKVQVFGGVVNAGKDLTNQAFEYDPQSDQWTALPNSNNAEYRGGGACGLYQVGGANQSGVSALAQSLPGYGSCNGDADVPWLSQDKPTFDVAPGASVKVRISMDSSVVGQPGDYLALVDVSTNTPYASASISATMHVTAPKAWGKLAGTVKDSVGSPLAGATVQVCTMYNTATGTCGPQSYTLKTDSNGYYQLWLNKGFNPLEIIAALQGYQPMLKVARVPAGGTTTVAFVLPAV